MSEPAARSRSSFWRSFGPGLIWAATSIGVSHLVQSTRAGAEAGFAFVGVIVVALILKYPFFEYGRATRPPRGGAWSRVTATIGTWALWLFLAITLVTAIISLAALAMFMAFLTRYAFGAEWPLAATAAVLMSACVVVLVVGRFRGLDITIKILLAMLVLSTIATAVVAAPPGRLLDAGPVAGRCRRHRRPLRLPPRPHRVDAVARRRCGMEQPVDAGQGQDDGRADIGR